MWFWLALSICHRARGDLALGIDLSGKMLDKAREINPSPSIEYERIAIEDFDFAPNSFDIVISSLTFHYLESFDTVCTEYINV